jgi:hypothetical protein
MKKLLILLVVTGLSYSSLAQDFQVPKDYAFKTAEDYAPYENDIVNCVNWLIETPANEYAAKRKEASAFLLQWLMGSPDVHIQINPKIVTFMNTSPDLLMIFMGGWAKHSIETKAYDDKVAGSLAGLESVVEYYDKNKSFIPKDKSVEKYVKMKQKGTLQKYVEENV